MVAILAHNPGGSLPFAVPVGVLVAVPVICLTAMAVMIAMRRYGLALAAFFAAAMAGLIALYLLARSVT